MPQISPINWVLILTFLVILASTSHPRLPVFASSKMQEKSNSPFFKTLKW